MSVLARRVLQEPWGWSNGNPGVEVVMPGRVHSPPGAVRAMRGRHRARPTERGGDYGADTRQSINF